MQAKAAVTSGATTQTSNSSAVAGTARDRVTPVDSSYDAQGRVIRRTFGAVASSGSEARTQWLTWDHLDRLIRVEERAVASTASAPPGASGFTWTALYDGLGRRVQTTLVYLTANGFNVVGDLAHARMNGSWVARIFKNL